MIAAWMVYTLVVGTLVAGAAWVTERIARGSGAPTRWIWATAIPVTLAWPIIARSFGNAGDPQQLPSIESAKTVLLDPALVRLVEPLATQVTALDPLLLWAWLALSTAGLGLLVWTDRRTYRLVRRLPTRTMHGLSVRVSNDLGPAVVGWPTGAIVVPRWTEELAEPERHMIIAHEWHHQRAHDSLLIGLAAFAVAVVPWNLPLWWMARRLRAAIEVDCDARVLRDGVTPAAYAVLLCSIAGRPRRPLRAAVAISHPTSLLARRIDHMLKPIVRAHPIKLAFAGIVAGAIIVAACEVPTPPEEPMGDADARERVLTEKARQAMTEVRVQEGGTFTLRADTMEFPLDRWMIDTDDPIVYVDGVRLTTTLRELSPDEIERIEVLKGAAARRILGADHAAGVIHIYTITKTGSN